MLPLVLEINEMLGFGQYDMKVDEEKDYNFHNDSTDSNLGKAFKEQSKKKRLGYVK